MSVKVSAWVWDQAIGDAEAKLVLLRLADQANGDGVCWPSKGSIARGCEMSSSTIKRSLRYLIDRDYITVEQRVRENGSFRSNLYQFPRYIQETGSDRPPTGSEGPGTGSVVDPGTGSDRPPLNQLLEPLVNQTLGGTTYRHMGKEGEERRARDAEGLTAEENGERLRKLRSDVGL